MKRLAIFFCLLAALSFSACGKKSKAYRIGVDPSFFPADIKGKEANVFAFTNELLQEISKIKKIKFQRVNASWDNLLWGLKEKKYEAALTSMYPYIFNQKKYLFSETYLLTGPVLVVREQMAVKALKDMSGKIVGVEAKSAEAKLLDNYPGIIPQDYLIIAPAFIDLADEKIDGLLCGILQASSYVDDLYAGKLKVATSPLNDQGLRLVTLYDGPKKIVDIFNDGLEELKKSGKYNELLKKWKLEMR